MLFTTLHQTRRSKTPRIGWCCCDWQVRERILQPRECKAWNLNLWSPGNFLLEDWRLKSVLSQAFCLSLSEEEHLGNRVYLAQSVTIRVTVSEPNTSSQLHTQSHHLQLHTFNMLTSLWARRNPFKPNLWKLPQRNSSHVLPDSAADLLVVFLWLLEAAVQEEMIAQLKWSIRQLRRTECVLMLCLCIDFGVGYLATLWHTVLFMCDTCTQAPDPPSINSKAGLLTHLRMVASLHRHADGASQQLVPLRLGAPLAHQ